MSNIRIDKDKAVKKWTPILENMGVSSDRVEWMSEYAEFHSINENAYVNATTNGMGTVTAAQPSLFAGNTTTNYNTALMGGSGDVGQNLLPVAMKIAGQTIGLDLVAVKPTPGPKIDLLYIDFRYDDNLNPEGDERPQVFKLDATNLTAIKAGIRFDMATAMITETQGGISGRLFYNISDGSVYTTLAAAKGANTPAGSLVNIVEFLGFSRVDDMPMFRAFRQANTASAGAYVYDQTLNTFPATGSMVGAIDTLPSTPAGTPLARTTAAVTSPKVDVISAMEDHIPGFVSNFNSDTTGFAGNYPMDRLMDDSRYAGVVAPKLSSKSVAVGTIEITSALRRTEIEDIKANTGLDIVQKMESVLVNELSQTISKQIVQRIFALGDLNRSTAPLNAGGQPIFDLDTAYAVGAMGLGGETTHAVQRKLITKIMHASNYIATEGRVGPAQYLITNGGLAAALSDISGYTLNPVNSKMNASGQLYPVGQIGGISIYVDPYQRYNDNRIVLGRKNNPDQPGLIFVPYLMAQSITVTSEATFAPRMLLRSRYAITEVGFFPQKQFMTIKVTDENQFLN